MTARWDIWRDRTGYQMCCCGDTYWTDASGRHDHRVRFGHAPTVVEECVRAHLRDVSANRRGLSVKVAEVIG